MSTGNTSTSTSTSSKPKPPKPTKGKSASVSTTTTTAKDDKQTHKLSLKGSAKMVAEFFDYSINTILFQRGVYPAEDFTPVKKYGLNMLVSCDDQVKSYLKRITTQLSRWLLAGKVKTLVVVITEKESGGDVERWQFDVSQVTGAAVSSSAPGATGDAGTTGATGAEKSKSETEIQNEIQSLFRQITASVTFLPILDGRFSFNVLVYADGDVEVPMEWGDSDPREINGGEKVALRSWGTLSHRVDTAVSYRVVE